MGGQGGPDGRFDLRLEDGRVAGVGMLEPRPGEVVIDLEGCFLTPGLIDAHVHLGIGEVRAGDEATALGESRGGPAGAADSPGARRLATNAAATLAQGVTAVRNLGNLLDGPAEETLRTMAADPACPGVVSAGRALTREGRYGGFLGRAVPGADDLADAAAREIDRGSSVVKVILSGGVDFETGTVEGPFFSLDDLRLVVALAHRRGVTVAAHANGESAIDLALRAEVDTLEHGILIGDEQLRRLAAGATRWVPTLTPLARLLGTPGTASLPLVFAAHRAAVQRGAELGVRVVAGSDSGCRGVPHSCLREELRELQDAGLSSSTVAAAATAEAAAALGLSGGYGRLEPGAATDLVWFADDPFAATLSPLRGLVRAGILLIFDQV